METPTTWPETLEIIDALKTLNNPVINSVIESYELAIDDLNAYREVLNDYRDEPDALKSIHSGINYRSNQTSALIPVLRKFYRLFYQEKQSLI